MKNIFKFLILVLLFHSISFANEAPVNDLIYHYFQAIQNKDLQTINRLFINQNPNRIKAYNAVFQATDQRINSIKIKNVKIFGNKGIVEVDADFLIISKVIPDSFNYQENQVFLLEKNSFNQWKIAKIITKEDFNLIIKNYFLKKGFEPLKEVTKVDFSYNTAESGEDFLNDGSYLNISGKWKTDFGILIITQNGNKIYGTYPHDSGKIEGTLNGNVLNCIWKEAPTYKPYNDAGECYFIFSRDGKKFTGKWRYGFNKSVWNGNWNGIKISDGSNIPNNTQIQTGDTSTSNMEYNTDRPGLDYKNFNLPANDPKLCKQVCDNDPKCKAWTFVKPNTIQGPNPRCWLKYAVPNPIKSNCCISGIKKQADMANAESWFKNWKIIKSLNSNIAGSNEKFGWKYPVRKIGDAMPPEGAKGAALYLHPISQTEPTHLQGHYHVSSNKKSLMFRVAGNKNGDWLMEVRVNGIKAFERVVDGKKWYELTIPLQKYYGQDITVDLFIKANGWFFEYAFIDEITLVNTQSIGPYGIEYNTDRPGFDYKNFDLPQNNALLCKQACDNDPKCKAWTFIKPNTIQGPNPRCWLKYAVPKPVLNTYCVSGVKNNTNNPSSNNNNVINDKHIYDDFNSFNNKLWIPLEWQTLNKAPNKITLYNGILDLKCNITDRSGFLASKPIKINRDEIITIKRRVKVHYANQYFEGGIWFYQTDKPEIVMPQNKATWLSAFGKQLFNVTYYNYYYEKPGVRQYVPAKHGFVISGLDWRNKKNYVVFPPIWDKWFEEEIVYDPGSNTAIYKINGQIGKVFTANMDKPYIRFIMHSYGWYTGHDIQIDWIKIDITKKENSAHNYNSNNLKMVNNSTFSIEQCAAYQFKNDYITKQIPNYLDKNIKTVYVTCKINNTPANTVLTAQWYYYDSDNSKIFILDYPYKIPQPNYTGYVTFNLEMPPEKIWPSGKYEVVITKDSNILKKINFYFK
ncbi:PAN domain-containing protein [Deferribacter autotrophicus]|nr:PAN domain-containing protein [Deferribacter autotrophicus]